MKWLKRMSSILLVVTVLSIVCAPLPIGAATYYVDPVNGSNAHNGLTPATAWKQVLPAGSGHTIVTLGEPEAPRKSTGPAGASALRAPGPATLDTGEVQRVVLGAELLAGWEPFSKTIWMAALPPGSAALYRVTSGGVWLDNGCDKDFLCAEECFWDGASGSLYINDEDGNPDTNGKEVLAWIYDLQIDDYRSVRVNGWFPSTPRVFQAERLFLTWPFYLLVDEEFYPKSDWWWGFPCSYVEDGVSQPLFMRHVSGDPDLTGRKTAVVSEGGGWSVTSGDFNGDGLMDVVTSNLSGLVFVHFGNVSFNGIRDQMLDEAGESTFGFQVASAGDVNGDGFDDLLVGLGWKVNEDDKFDKVYLFKGSAAGFQPVPDVVITPPTALTPFITEDGLVVYGFGHSLSTHPGDVNGDGYDDVLIGAAGDKNYACIYLGSSSGIDQKNVQIIPYTPYPEGVGYISLSHAGDLNGDGFGDIATSPSQITEVSLADPLLKFYVYEGSSVGVKPSAAAIVSLPAGVVDFPIARNLYPVPAGDLNGDGRDDLLVGSQYATGQYSNEGKVYIFHGSSAALVASDPDAIIDNPAPAENVRFGAALEGIGDFNHDGYNDLLVGCPYCIDSGFGAIYYGLAKGVFQSPSLFLKTPHNLGLSLAHAGEMTASKTNYVIIGEAFAGSFIYGIRPASVPDAPTQVTAVSGNGQATVSFTAPADNGSPITLYAVTSNPGGVNATGPASPITVPGLANGAAYTFTVTATNAIGTGPASAPSNSVTQTAPVTPSAPSAPSGLAAHGTSSPFAVNLSWADNSNNEDGFTIQRATNARFTAGLTPIPVGPNLSVFSDSTAMPLTRYYYRVQAFNGVAQTAFSNPVNVRTPALPVHVGGLGALIHDAGGTRTVDATVTVLDGSNQPASGVKVTGKWTGGRGGARSCMTDGAGQCTVNTMVKEINGSVTFGVKGMKRKGCKYDPASNVQAVLTVQ